MSFGPYIKIPMSAATPSICDQIDTEALGWLDESSTWR